MGLPTAPREHGRRLGWEASPAGSPTAAARESRDTTTEYDPSRPVERAYETRLYGHYGRPSYWDWDD
jgi:hypothetical protein